MHEATVRRTGHSRKNPELFLYMRLTTADQSSLLADEDVAQAAQTALAAQARMQRCRVQAINTDQHTLHVVVQFPASLSPKLLAEILRDASAVAVTRVLSVRWLDSFQPHDVWAGFPQIDTLSPGDVPATIAYVCHHIGKLPAEQLTWHDFLRGEAGSSGSGLTP